MPQGNLKKEKVRDAARKNRLVERLIKDDKPVGQAKPPPGPPKAS